MKSESEAIQNVKLAARPIRREFLCGVVEGFYGRPWTTEKRKDLFSKMEAWDMNSYLYAPKDDCKHRAYWRELYTVEEAEHLQSLISLATECNIDFYYAISPGLDITYSSSKEVACLKRKLDQVNQLGCRSFALLFDDIEPEMCKQDKEVFQSFAHAQVTLTNDVYQHLGQPNFLFCPTQYCTARAVPTVRNSEYLKTVGSNLAPEIKIMWTGDKVISKIISKKTLEDINEVLKRKVVIWDNEHANDYDQKRVFLGPYSGRSPEIISDLSGVLTNPNCEYWANFVAIHTLSQWSKCKIDGTQPYASANEAISADIKLEIQACDGRGDMEPSVMSSDVYHPKNALIKAVTDWIPEFSKQKTVWGPMSKPQVGLTQPPLISSLSTCMVPTSTMPPLAKSVSQESTSNPAEKPEPNSSSVLNPPVINGAPVNIPTLPSSLSIDSQTSTTSSQPATTCPSSTMQPVSLPVMNSLVSTNKVVVDHTLIDNNNPSNNISTPSTSTVPSCNNTDADTPMSAPLTVYPDNPTPSLVPPPSAPHVPPPPIAPTIPLPDTIIPGPTYLEPMDTVSHPEAESPSRDNKMGGAPDIAMESITNPPTPGSGMQVEGAVVNHDSSSPSSGTLHKAESTTMICEPSDITTSGSSPLPDSFIQQRNGEIPSSANLKSSSNPLVPIKGDNITNNPEVTTMLCEEICTDIKEVGNPKISVQDLILLCQLFYLPSDHGQVGLDLLDDFFWLKRNASTMLPPGTIGAGTPEDRLEWEQRAAKFKSNVTDIQTLFVKLCSCQNRELVYDLYTYLWDMCGVVQTLEGFVQWMSKGSCSPKSQTYVLGQQTWFSGLREAFISGDHEPWMFRGGLVSDLLRLLPLDSGNDLYHYKFPEVPAPLLYYVRPFQPKDEDALYALAADCFEKTIDAPMGLCQADRDLIGDKLIGAYITLCPEYTFVCENSMDGSIVGFTCAAPDAKAFYTRHSVAWLPEMRLKYPQKKGITDEEMMTPLEQMAQSFFTSAAEPAIPSGILNPSPPVNSDQPIQPWAMAIMRMNNQELLEISAAKRLTMLLLASLRASGTLRLFVETEKQQDFYSSLGFVPLIEGIKERKEEKTRFMQRCF